MAVRRATRTYDDLRAFLDEYPTTLALGAVELPGDAVRGELAPEVNLDLVLPLVGRVGPVRAQLIHKGTDGRYALRLQDDGGKVTQAYEQVIGAVDSVRDLLVSRGELVAPDDLDALRDEVQALRDQVAALQAGGAAAPSGDDDDDPFILDDSPAPDQAQAPAAPPAARPASAQQKRSGRGFQVPDLSQSAPAVGGSMGDRSLRDAMIQLAMERVTGVLTIKTSTHTRYGFWSTGGPVGWRTDPLIEAEVLGVLLFKAKQLTKEHVAESLRIMEIKQCRQGEALMEMGVITFPQLIMVLGKQVEFVLQQALTERDGEWTFHVLDALPERFLPSPLKVPSLMYRSIVKLAREQRSDDLYAAHKPNIDKYLSFEEDVGALLVDMKFSRPEQKLVQIIQSGSYRMRELFSVSPLSRIATAAVLFAWVEMGLLAFSVTEAESRYLERARSRIERKKNQVAMSRHFEFLEVHWICLSVDVEAAYARLKEEFSPSKYRNLPDDLVAALKLINQRLDEAYGILKVDGQRREYRATIIEKDMILQSADLLGKKGEMAIMRKDRRDAVACYAKAIELVPGNYGYRDGLKRASTVV